MSKQKSFRPQTLFSRILADHTGWLFQAGYHERALGLREAPGRLEKFLRESLEQAVTTTLWSYRMEEFAIGTRGVFTNKKDPVTFTFRYTYDPAYIRLHLTHLTAQLDNETITYPITNDIRRSLPSADVVHQQLRRTLDAQLLAQVERSAPRAKVRR